MYGLWRYILVSIYGMTPPPLSYRKISRVGFHVTACVLCSMENGWRGEPRPFLLYMRAYLCIWNTVSSYIFLCWAHLELGGMVGRGGRSYIIPAPSYQKLCKTMCDAFLRFLEGVNRVNYAFSTLKTNAQFQVCAISHFFDLSGEHHIISCHFFLNGKRYQKSCFIWPLIFFNFTSFIFWHRYFSLTVLEIFCLCLCKIEPTHLCT